MDKRKYAKSGYNRGELARNLMITLGHGAIVLALFFAPNAGRMFELFGDDFIPEHKKAYRQRERIRRAIERLKKKRLVITYKRGEETVVELTQVGKKRLLAYKLDDLELKRPRRWDKIWRFLIFDIPESRHRARNALTSVLHRLGFFNLQKSVWVTPYPCKDEIDFIAEVFDIGDHLHYLETKIFDDESKLKLHFFKNSKDVD